VVTRTVDDDPARATVKGSVARILAKLGFRGGFWPC
jgi:hypothetical protein